MTTPAVYHQSRPHRKYSFIVNKPRVWQFAGPSAVYRRSGNHGGMEISAGGPRAGGSAGCCTGLSAGGISVLTLEMKRDEVSTSSDRSHPPSEAWRLLRPPPRLLIRYIIPSTHQQHIMQQKLIHPIPDTWNAFFRGKFPITEIFTNYFSVIWNFPRKTRSMYPESGVISIISNEYNSLICNMYNLLYVVHLVVHTTNQWMLVTGGSWQY